MFDKVSEIIDGGGIVYFLYIWFLIIFIYIILLVENINCMFLNVELMLICDFINNLIDSVNIEIYNFIMDVKLRMVKVLDVIFKFKFEDLINIDFGVNLEIIIIVVL